MKITKETFAEAKGADRTDWCKKLRQLKKLKHAADLGVRGDSAYHAYETAFRLARAASANWVTCACGNQCAVIPRHIDGRPWDTELDRLGVGFYFHVNMEEFDKALEILAKIEVRAAAVIAQIERDRFSPPLTKETNNDVTDQ